MDITGIYILEGRRAHSRKGNTWPEAEMSVCMRVCIRDCGPCMRALVFLRLEAGLIEWAGGENLPRLGCGCCLRTRKSREMTPRPPRWPELLLRLGACRLSCIRLERTCSPRPTHRQHLLMGPRAPPLPSWPALASWSPVGKGSSPHRCSLSPIWGQNRFFFDLLEIAAI